MIGNDIVDLNYAAKHSNWQRPRFLDKIFTKKEQRHIFNAKDKHQMVWLLWSMKEAAYKVNVQQFKKRFFNPKKIKCSLISDEKGVITIDESTYFTNTKITKDYVYTIATLNNKDLFKSECFKVETSNYKTQSNTLKIHLKKALNIEGLDIKKNDIGIPKLFNNNNNNKEMPITLSLTHCGNFCGYVYY